MAKGLAHSEGLSQVYDVFVCGLEGGGEIKKSA